jgi:hypothetical protein
MNSAMAEENSERILDQEITAIKTVTAEATGNLARKDIDPDPVTIYIFKGNSSSNSLKKNNEISLQPWHVMTPGFFN